MENPPNQGKLAELAANGYMHTGKYYRVLLGENKGKELPVYAQKGDVAGLVYNPETDRIELVYRLAAPFTGEPSRASQLLKEIKKHGAQ